MEKTSAKRQMIGQIVSNKMNNTVVVKIEHIKVHPKYHKRFKVSKKHAAHNTDPEIKVGDRVIIEETKPISKTKNWKVIGKVSK